jgi:hypothetical protein
VTHANKRLAQNGKTPGTNGEPNSLLGGPMPNIPPHQPQSHIIRDLFTSVGIVVIMAAAITIARSTIFPEDDPPQPHDKAPAAEQTSSAITTAISHCEDCTVEQWFHRLASDDENNPTVAFYCPKDTPACDEAMSHYFLCTLSGRCRPEEKWGPQDDRSP